MLDELAAAQEDTDVTDLLGRAGTAAPMTDASRWVLAAAGAGFTAGWLLLAWWVGARDIAGVIRRWVRSVGPARRRER